MPNLPIIGQYIQEIEFFEMQNVVIILVIIISVTFFQRSTQKFVDICDDLDITPSDYTIIAKDIVVDKEEDLKDGKTTA